MPYIFLSDEAIASLKDEISEQILELEDQIWMKKAIWNDLDNIVSLPERTETAIRPPSECPEKLKGLGRAAVEETHEAKHPQEKTEKDTKIGKPIIPLTKQDLTIESFKHDKTQEKSYKTLSYLEKEDGRVVLLYMSNKICTTKEKILALPYPIPKGYLKDSGLTANQITAIRFYRELLFTRMISENTKKNTAKPEDIQENKPNLIDIYKCGCGSEYLKSKHDICPVCKRGRVVDGLDDWKPGRLESPDDWKYKKLLNTNTRPNRDEEKIEGCLE